MDQGICGFPSRLSLEAFTRVFPTGLSHVPLWCESILGLKVEEFGNVSDGEFTSFWNKINKKLKSESMFTGVV